MADGGEDWQTPRTLSLVAWAGDRSPTVGGKRSETYVGKDQALFFSVYSVCEHSCRD